MNNKKATTAFIFATILIDIIGIGLIIPILPALLKEIGGLDTSEGAFYGGLLAATYSVMQFIFAPILGGLSDQFGRKPLLLLALLGLGLDYVIIIFAPNLFFFFLARLVAGICGSSMTVANAYIADISTPENRAKNFGMIGAAFGVGFVIGPSIGGLLGEVGTKVPFIAAAILTFINLIYGYFIIPESLTKENRRNFDWKRANPIGTLRQLFKLKTILGLVLSLFLIYIAAAATHANWPYFTTEKFGWTSKDIGLSLTFVGIMISIVQGGVVGLVVKKIGEKRAVFVGFIFNAIGLALMGIVPQGWMIYLVIVPYALGGLAGPSLQSIITGQVPKNTQGELQGGLTSILTLSNIIGPILMTGVFRFFTKPDNSIYFAGAPFILGTLLAIISIFSVFVSLKKS